MPKVSVVIPTCNRPELLRKALFSVLNQTYQDFEIIVVDDGMEERADKVIKDVNDDRIKYIQHEKSRGGGAARNTGIKAAGGEYIAFLDDDDEWTDKKLEMQVEKLEKSGNEVGFCFTAVTNDTGDQIFNTKVPEEIEDYYERTLAYFKGFLTVTLLFKKEVFDNAGLFDESLPSHQEAELMIRVAKKYKGIGINKPLVLVNFDPNHKSVGRSLEKRIKGMEILLKKHHEEYRDRPKILARHLFNLANFYLKNKNKKNARLNLKRALKLNSNWRYMVHYIKTFLV